MDLSIIIPSRNEMFLSKTVEDLLANIRGNTEIIAVLDGNWPNPPVKDNPRVTLIYHSQSIGQRAACNEAARYSRAKYIAKCDAHCGFDEGFDVKLLADMQDDWTMVPIMRNLWAFDYVCEDGHSRYQSPPGPCKECGKPTTMDMKWISKTNPQSTVYTFDPTPHFQYMNECKRRPEYQKAAKEIGLTETMSLQGSFFMMTRKKYFELGMNDEVFGSWGSQGIEVAVKTWLSGGKVICSHKSFYSHMFRTQGPGFNFPYEISGRQVERAKQRAKKLFFGGSWGTQQILPLSWLVEKFWPVPHWSEEDLRRLKESEAGTTFVNLQNKLHGVLGVVPIVPGPMTDHTSAVSSTVGRGEQMSVLTVGKPGLPGNNLALEATLVSCKGTSPTLTVGGTDETNTKGRTIGEVTGRGQEMPSDAMSLGTIDGRDGIGGSEVINLQFQTEVKRIATGSVVADSMIKDRNASGIPHGDRTNEPGVGQSMHTEGLVVANGLSEVLERNQPVSILVKSTSPDPAFVKRINGVNVDFSKKSFDNTCGKGGNSEIIGISHSSYLPEGNENRLESGGCLNHSPDLTIISPPIASVKPSSPSRGIIYYSDSLLDPAILEPCQKQLLRSVNGYPIVSVTLKPMDFGENYTLPLERSVLTMFKQILEGVKRSTSDILFFTEHDCLYTKEHFLFTPPRKDVFYYNENQWQVDSTTGRALFYHCMRLSAMCAYRELLLEHYTKRVERVEKEGFTLRMGYEPGGHRYPRGVDNYTRDRFMTPYPLIDLRHTGTVSPNRWRKRDFRNQGPLWAWTEADEIPFWGRTKGRMKEFLDGIGRSDQ